MKLRPIRPGDTLALVSPASPVDESRLEFAVDLLSQAGYRLKPYPHTFLAGHGYLAAPDRQRANDLHAAFADEEVSAVFCTRGGYGCARLLPHLDLQLLVQSRKALIGFSDLTTLHLALNRRGVPTLHAPMGLTLSRPRAPWVYDSLFRALQGDFALSHEATNATTVVPGTVEGTAIGGCLSLIADSIGTPDGLATEGKILFIEGVDDPPHRIDAMLTHLVLSGLAQQAEGFVIGEMTGCESKADQGIGTLPWREIVIDRLAPLGKPMILDYPFGHMANMATVGLGLRVRLDAAMGTVTTLENPFL